MSLYHNGHAPLSQSSSTYSAYSLQCHRGCWALRSEVWGILHPQFCDFRKAAIPWSLRSPTWPLQL